MAGKPAVKVTGVVEFQKAVRKMARDVSDLSTTNRSAGERVAASARSHAPRLTGRLAGTIHVAEVERMRVVVEAGSGVPYAGPIHNGWPAHNITAQPFMDEAAEREHDRVVQDYSDRVGDLVIAVGRES